MLNFSFGSPVLPTTKSFLTYKSHQEMVPPNSLLVSAVFASLTAALSSGGGGYRSSEGSGRGGRASSSLGTGGLSGGLSGYALGSIVRSLSHSGDYPASGKGASSAGEDSTASETSTDENPQIPGNTTGLYAITNVTIHQYPRSTNGLNNSSLVPIIEDINLWAFNIDSGKPNAATAAHCNLTWTASTASPLGPPATGRMTCVSRNMDHVSKGLPNYSPQYNVTFQQQTESPLPGFNLFVTSG